ncbi:MAG: Lrp/AsnC family transcriptional regulator [Methanomassiliicoccales archaeon]|nr:MAG: Lrp/AsnC family transcriptional regulator [Methanomassiliicoccales archaeon]
MTTALDEKDMAILAELMKDARRSTKAIAKDLNIPRATVHERIKRMLDRGIIKGFTVLPDYIKLGEPVTAFILVSFLPNSSVSQREVAQRIAMLEGVQEVHLISGEHDIIIKVRGRSMESIGSLVIDKLRAIPGVGKTLTMASFTTIKDI